MNPILPCYLISNFLMMSFSSFFLMWVVLEINSLMFIYFSYASGNSSCSKSDYFQHGLFYFMIQSFFSILLLISLFSSSDNSFMFMNFFLIFFVILFKMSLFPMEIWIIYISKYLSAHSIFILLTLQKFPLILFSLNMFSDWILVYVIFSSFCSSFMIFSCYDLLNLVLYSSIYGNFWLMLIYFYDSFYFLFFFFALYCPLIFFLCNFIKMNNTDTKSYAIILSILSFLCSIPPFSFFLFKFNLFSYTLINMGIFFMIFSWFLGFISLVGYFNFLYVFFFVQKNVYSTKLSSNFFPMFLLFLSLFLFI